MSLTLITSAPASDDEYRAGLIVRYLTARSSWEREALRKEAADYDKANPGASLADELYGAALGDVA